MGHGITRREVLKGVSALGAAGLTSGIGIAFGQGVLSATTYPGAWEEAHRSILIESLLEPVDQPQRINERRMPGAGVIDDVWKRGRRIDQRAEILVGLMRRQHRSTERRDGGSGKKRQSQAAHVIGSHACADRPRRARRPTPASPAR